LEFKILQAHIQVPESVLFRKFCAMTARNTQRAAKLAQTLT
jgi:hypothetical protein